VFDKQLVKEAAIAYATARNSMEFHGLGVTEHEQGLKNSDVNCRFSNDYWEYWQKRSWGKIHLEDKK
jgi:hypothetical protein